MIAPGFRWRIVDRMVTNFHQPQSTLLLLVSSFLGADNSGLPAGVESTRRLLPATTGFFLTATHVFLSVAIVSPCLIEFYGFEIDSYRTASWLEKYCRESLDMLPDSRQEKTA